MAKYKIDPALEEQLKKRGMTSSLSNLNSATEKTSTISNFLPSLGSTIVKTPGAILKGADAVLDTGIPTLGKAYGGAILGQSGYADKMQNELARTNTALGDKVMQQIRDPKIPAQSKTKLVNMYRDINPDIMNQIPELQISTKDILASSAKLAVTIALLGNSPASPAGKVNSFSYVNPAVNKELLTWASNTSKLTQAARWAKYGPQIGSALNLAEKYGPTMAYDALLGTSYGVADAAGKNKTIEQIKTSAVDYGFMNMLAPAAGGIILRGLSQGLRSTGHGIQAVAKPLRDAAEKYALGTTLEQRLAEAVTLEDKLLARDVPAKTTMQNMAAKVVKGYDYLASTKAKFVDKGAPIEQFREAYKDYRLGTSRATDASFLAKKKLVDEVIPTDPALKKSFLAKLNLLDEIDRAKMGNETVSGQSVNELENELAQLEVQHHDRGISEQVQTAIDNYNNFNVQRLQELVDNNYIPKEKLDDLTTTHPNYIPHDNVARTLDDGYSRATGGSLNPSNSSIQTANGSAREKTETIQSVFDRLDNHFQILEKSKLTDDLIKADTAGLFTVAESEANHTTRKTLAEEYHGLVVDLKKKFKEFSTNNKFSKKVTAKFNDIQESIKGMSSDLENELSAYLSDVKIKEVKPTITSTGFKTPGAKYSRLIDLTNELSSSGKSRDEISKALMADNEFFKLFETGQLEAEGFKTVDNFIEGSLTGKTTITTGEKTVERTAKKSVVTDLNNKITSLKDTMESVGIKKETMDEYIGILQNQIEAIKGKKVDIKNKFAELKNTEDLSTLALQEKGLAPINRWVNGYKETWFVPKEIAAAIKNLDQEAATGFVKFWGGVNNVFKQMVTGYNIPFSINNKGKDVQTAYATADILINKALKDLNLPQGIRKDLGLDAEGFANLYRKGGGSGADIISESSLQTANKTIEEMRKTGFAKFLSNTRPDKAILEMNKLMESSTRLDVFKRALEAGLPLDEAVLIARDATVDFAKMGSSMKTLNQIFPFLNARVQGVVNMSKVASADPLAFARKMYYTSVIPSVLVDKHNSQFQGNENVSPDIDANYWRINYDSVKVRDQDGRDIYIPKYVVVKKGELQSLASVGVNEFLRRLRGQDPKSAAELAWQLTQSVSPISVGGYNPSALWTAPIAATGPIGKIMIGLGTNIDPYTGLKINKLENVSPSENYIKTTDKILVDAGSTQLAKTLGVSPSQIDFIIKAVGSVPTQITDTANITQGLVKGEGVRQTNLSGDIFSNMPLFNAFIREGSYIGSDSYKKGVKQESAIKVAEGDINIKNKRQADLIIDDAYRITDTTERKNFLQNVAKNYSDDIVNKAVVEYKSRNAEGYLRPGMDTEVVANFVYQDLIKMQQSGVDEIGVKNYLQNLDKKGIISDEAASKISGLRQYGIYLGGITAAKTQEEKNSLIISALADMKNKGVKDMYAGLFLTKMENDGDINPSTLPIIRNAVQTIFKK